MNIIHITTGCPFDERFSEYMFKTNCLKREIYDENFNLTDSFINWLKDNKPNIVDSYYNDRMTFEILYIHNDSMDEVMF